MNIEVFRAENPSQIQRYGKALEAGIVPGNMGSLVVLKLGSGLELAEHSHEQEHVGAVLAGEFSFTHGDEETVLSAGDLYRVPPNMRHGVRCTDHALVVQVRADFQIGPKEIDVGTREGGETMKKLLFLGLVAGAVAATVAQWPEIQRYLKIRNM